MVKVAINSVLTQDYDNYDLHIIDDNEFKTVDIAHPDVSYVLSGDSNEFKQAHGSRHGKLMNDKLDSTDADIAIILCDDDALVEGYLRKLNDYYQNHKGYSYCHVIEYNPLSKAVSKALSPLNLTEDIIPQCKVDASQVSWSIGESRFSEDRTLNLDAFLFGVLYLLHGRCPFNGIVGQYKGVFDGQMGSREEIYF